MTKEHLDAIRGRAAACASYRQSREVIAINDDRLTLIAEVERLIVERDDLKSAVDDLNAGLDAQDQVLTNKYNAQLRRAEKAEAAYEAIFQQGVEAMRQAAAEEVDCNDPECGCRGDRHAERIRALPTPEYKP